MRRILVLSITIALFATACGGSGGVLSAANWCETAKSVDTASNALDAPTADNIREFERLLNDAKGSAPAEIRDDVNLMAEFSQQLSKALDENDNNIFLAFDAMGGALNDPKYENAGNRITAYNERECGITDPNTSDNSDNSSSPGSSTSDTSPATTTSGSSASDTSPSTTSPDISGGSTDTSLPPELITSIAQAIGVTEDQARCLISKFDLASGETLDFTNMLSGFADCGIDPATLGAGG